MAANERFPVKLFPTATASDVLFYVVVGRMDKRKIPEYGTPYNDITPRVEDWPHHRLVHISPPDSEGSQRWWFAADREEQDCYNWDIGQGVELIRTYLVRRDLYLQRSEAEAEADPRQEGEFTYPVVATLDTQFTKYGFADDSVLEAPDELKSLYVVVKRRYIEPITTDYQWSDQLQRSIKITKTLIPAGSGQPPTLVPGVQSEVQSGNIFHDILITQELVFDGEEDYPLALTPLPSTYNQRFPSRLDSISLVGAWAWASSTGVSDSYSEDYYFKFHITEPRPGPYQATALRFITDDPTALQATYPVDTVPTPVTESIAVVAAWFYASTDGNQTFATAKEWSVPETIHGEIELVLGGNIEDRPADHSAYNSGNLPATPGSAAFFELSTMTVDYDVKPAPLGLYEVTVVQINKTNLYA